MQRWLNNPASGGRVRKALVTGLAGMAGVSSLFLILNLIAFDTKPGAAAAPPRVWPSATKIRTTPHRAHLVMFVHPGCGCTGASLAELRKIDTLWVPASPDVTFVVFRPKNSRVEWNALNDSEKFPGSRMVWDEDGAEARRFSVRTSGTVLLYDNEGKLLFDGGITESRGHEGDNYGLAELTARLGSPSRTGKQSVSTRVFGCALIAAAGGGD